MIDYRKLEGDLRDLLVSYMDEETDGEFLRYYRLNPVALEPLIEDLIDAADEAYA